MRRLVVSRCFCFSPHWKFLLLPLLLLLLLPLFSCVRFISGFYTHSW